MCISLSPYLFIQHTSVLECCEKYKSFKLKIPQPDLERRHSPDFRTVFGIMIGPFSSCEIGKTWGTNKQVNKQTNKNWKFQFPQPDYRPRHSPDFRTVFGIMIGPFSSCEIGKQANRSQIFVSGTRSARFESEKKPLLLLFLTSEKSSTKLPFGRTE